MSIRIPVTVLDFCDKSSITCCTEQVHDELHWKSCILEEVIEEDGNLLVHHVNQGLGLRTEWDDGKDRTQLSCLIQFHKE